MTGITEAVDTAASPLAPVNPLPLGTALKALRKFHVGQEQLRDAGGYVTRVTFGPRWLSPPMVVVTSPQGIHDVLGRSDAFVDKTLMHEQMRQLLGDNLFDLPHDEWLPRRRALQPVFTKKRVREFGDHMRRAAQSVGDAWPDGGDIDLDVESRRLTMRALGRSVLGLDLDERADAVSEPLQLVLTYIADRSFRPVRAPGWLPNPARYRARTAAAALHALARDILSDCRADPAREAPLVRALMAAADPETGAPMSDEDICNELVVFMAAGHDTTATTLCYAMWALGRHPDLQNRVLAEVAELGDRDITPDDIDDLTYTVQVLHEALRLCPPGAGAARVAKQDMIIDGYRVEAGSQVLVGIYAVQRDPALWTDPLTFDPDRFTPELSKRRDRWQYLPFGRGPRSCIGDHFAMLESTLALATVVRSHEIIAHEPDFPMAVPFTTVAAKPIPVRVRRRPG
jgi:cytochrome P450